VGCTRSFPVACRDPDGFHCICLPFFPLGVVALELLVCKGGETIDGVRSQLLVVVAEDAGGELLDGVVGFLTKGVWPNVRGTADVLGLDGWRHCVHR